MANQTPEIESLNSRIKLTLLKYMSKPGVYTTQIKGFNLVRREDGDTCECCFEKPLLGLVIQGTKHSFMSGHEYAYTQNQSIVAGVDMPISSRVLNPSHERPFLFLYLYLDKNLLSSLSFEMKDSYYRSHSPETGVSIADADVDLLEMFLRLLELNAKPEQIAMRAPMMLRELHYLLLISPHGNLLRNLHTPGSQNNQVVQAINWIRDNFKVQMRVEALAKYAGMSVSSLHRHFKIVTGLSPLQYQKQLRLFEAQRLMLMENQSASTVAFEVGYESVAQFNRDYKRIFGEPPLRDINRRRNTTI